MDQRSGIELVDKLIPLRSEPEVGDPVVRCLIDLVVKESEVAGSVLAEMRFARTGDADDEPDVQMATADSGSPAASPSP
jgi:hypothetical protein